MTAKNYPGPDSIHRHQLENGIVVLAYENFASESIEVEGLVWAGALGEDHNQAGLAAFTARTLMRGTQNRSFESLYDELESVGAQLGFSAGRHTTGFSAASLAEDLDLVLTLAADTLRNPVFPADHVEKVRGEILTGLQIQANDTRSQASKAFYALLYNGHPYGTELSGTPETVTSLTPEDLHAFHAAYYGPRQMIVTIVGAVKAEEAVDKVRRVLGDWSRPGQLTLPDVPDAARPPSITRTHVRMAEKTQSDIVMGLPGPRRSAPDFQDARLANTILGVFGMYGRLGKTVREEQGLAYYVYSRLSGSLGPAPWIAGTGVAPDKVEQAIAGIRQEIHRIQDELVPVEEVEDSKAYLTGSLPVSLETNDGLASIITDMEVYNLGLDYLRRYPDMVNEVTPERVQAAARKYFSADEIAIAVAGPDMNA
ncbi:MAG: insulinase family protein [Anaerolineales bacterium]|nr:insulinase family protein [Anaerolineales bacterium]MCB8953393.1 insulinase family protein [Ardenticatenales bacterium]